MGLFDDAGIDASELNVGKLVGDYKAVVTNVEQKKSKKDDPYLVFSYTLPESDFPVQDWFILLPEGKTFADLDDTDGEAHAYDTAKGAHVKQTELAFYKRAYKNLKARLVDLGVPEDQVNSVNPEEVIGTEIILTLRENPKSDFPTISKVTIPGASGTSLPTIAPAATPTASATSAPASASAAAAPSGVNPFAKTSL